MTDPISPLDPSEVDRIKNSPVLHLSLGSKELFHSNLIAFFCERHPKEMAKALGGLLPAGETPCSIDDVRREKDHFDLAFTLGGTRVVVELKVKSLPRPAQLEEYAKKAGTAGRLWLWSLWKPDFFKGEPSWPAAGNRIWEFFALEDVVRRIHTHVRGAADGYLGGLLDDWLGLVDWLARVRDAVVANDARGFWETARRLKALNELRVHDLFAKAHYDLLSQAIEERVAPFAQAQSIQVDPGGMSRSQGVCSVYRDLAGSAGDGKQWVRIGVQIQGRQFRLFSNTASTDGERARKIANHLSEGRWFDVAGLVKKYADLLEPANMRKPFGAFAPSFFYRYALLKDDAPLRDIARVAAEVVASADPDEVGWHP